jgi:hypothetical protein
MITAFVEAQVIREPDRCAGNTGTDAGLCSIREDEAQLHINDGPRRGHQSAERVTTGSLPERS